MLELKIPPPIYALLIGSLMWWFSQIAPAMNMIPTQLSPLGLGLIGLALSMELWSLLLFLIARTTFSPFQPNNSKQLVISGLYRLSRNPMYLGLMTTLIGWAIYQTNLLSFALLPLFYWLITTQQILPEERILEKKFGAEYLHYKSQVRRWL